MNLTARPRRYVLLLSALFFFLVTLSSASVTQTTPQSDQPVEQADVPADVAPITAHASAAAATAHAWQILDTALSSSKPELRISAVTALGTIQRSRQAAAGVEKALSDPDRDVRLAAVRAAGAMHTALLIPALRKSLDDPAADISFVASEVLWQMGDHSGEDILVQVLTGERKGAPGFFKSSLHTANKDLHSPSTLAMIGAEQGAYALIGPFGVGLDAARLMVKSGNSANSARVSALVLLAQDKRVSTNAELITAVTDKDYFVRAAAARELGEFHNKESGDALLGAFSDSKPLVRYMAAAAYIRSTATTARNRRRVHILHKRPSPSAASPSLNRPSAQPGR